MSNQTYLIDTNVVIHLEDNRAVDPAFSAFTSLAARHKVDIFVHEAARDDLCRDRDSERRRIALSKLNKFQTLAKVRGLTSATLQCEFGLLAKANDVVDATLLHAVHIGAVDFLVTQDRGLHDRARRHSPELGRRVLYVADAVQLIRTTYEPSEPPIRFVEEVEAHTIPLTDAIFDSLREDYSDFNHWWTNKCIKQRRPCWIVEDDGIAGLIVRKDETGVNTDASQKFQKILKLCTFKVRPEKRGIKIGELLLKKALWFTQRNDYNLIYITAFPKHTSLIDLLEYYGFVYTVTKDDGERIYEKIVSSVRLSAVVDESRFDTHRLNYPRFVIALDTKAFMVPIKENYHDALYPDLRQQKQLDLFDPQGRSGGPRRAGNTIRKVYLCRAPSMLAAPGSLLLFYKGRSRLYPSQSITAIGILEDVQLAHSMKDLLHMTGGRSVYTEQDLERWQATASNPVKVINYLLASYVEPPIELKQLQELGIVGAHPPQSIRNVARGKLELLLPLIDLGFAP